MSDDPDWRSDSDEEEWARQAVYEERVANKAAKDERIRAQDVTRTLDADELARRLLLLASLESAVAEAVARTKEALAHRMSPGDLKRPQIAGRPAGSVSYSAGAPRVTVTDPAALLAYVEQHYTTELELTTTIRESFLSAILEATKAAGEPCAPDGTLGVPGLSVLAGMPRITARPDKARAGELWAEARANPLRLITSQEQP